MAHHKRKRPKHQTRPDRSGWCASPARTKQRAAAHDEAEQREDTDLGLDEYSDAIYGDWWGRG